MNLNSTEATLLCRVSSDKQAENYSLAMQERNGRLYADKLGLTITHVFKFVESASKAQRKRFDEYLRAVVNGPEQHVLMLKVDRGLRKLADLERLFELTERYGKSIHFFDENVVLDRHSSPTEHLRLMVTASFAAFYVRDLAVKTKKGMIEKATQGEWPHKAPAGYRNNKETKLLEVNEELRRWIIRIHKLAASGEHSIDSILQCLKREGCPKRFPRSNIALILRNPIYAGSFHWPKKDGPLIRGKHEPIVTQELKDAALAGLERFNKPRYAKYSHPYQGLIVCGNCGCAIVTETKKKRFVYAHCTWRRPCENRAYVKQEMIDSQFEAVFRRIQLDAPLIKQIVAQMEKKSSELVADQMAKIAQLKQEQGKLNARISNAMDAVADGDETGGWKMKLREYHARAAVNQNEQRALESASPADFMAKARRALELTKDLSTIWKRAEADRRRELVKTVCSNCTLNGEKLSVSLRKPFDIMAEMASCPNWRPLLSQIRTALLANGIETYSGRSRISPL